MSSVAKAAAGALACACACALAIVMAAVPFGASDAWAAEVHPTQSRISVGNSGACTVNVAGISGEAGETVFVTVTCGAETIVKLYAYTIESETDLFAIEVGSQEKLETMLNQGLVVHVDADRAGSIVLYEGTVWPVRASLARDGGEVETLLIGTHTGSDAFTAPESLLSGGQAYRLVGAAEQSGNNALTFNYEAYSPENSVDGSIRYIDLSTGSVLSTYTTIPGLVSGAEARAVEIPQIVESDGKTYRTLSFESVVYASNPGATTFTVSVVELSAEAASAAGHYMAVINMVDGSGAIIAADAVFVKGDVLYTVPDVIFRAASSDDPAQTFVLAAGEPSVLEFSAATDGITSGTRTVEVHYEAAAPGAGGAATFVLQDGSKRAGDPTRTIGTFEGALPPATYTSADGVAYKLVGEPSAYGPIDYGVVDAYYLPADYSGTQEPYQVKVSYVDFATRETIDSETFTSSPDDLEDVVFTPPAQFAKDGVTWLRLDGQDQLAHNYWSQIAEYTVYYRDRAKPIESAPVITQIRVVYRDGGVTYVNNGTTYTGATGGAGGTGGTTSTGLSSSSTYNVAQGQGTNQSVTGQDGRDIAQQRIEDVTNPLASGTGSASTDTKQGEGLPVPALVGGGVAGVAALIAALVAILKRRRED